MRAGQSRGGERGVASVRRRSKGAESRGERLREAGNVAWGEEACVEQTLQCEGSLRPGVYVTRLSRPGPSRRRRWRSKPGRNPSSLAKRGRKLGMHGEGRGLTSRRHGCCAACSISTETGVGGSCLATRVLWLYGRESNWAGGSGQEKLTADAVTAPPAQQRAVRMANASTLRPTSIVGLIRSGPGHSC